jgi:hypothetical protein
MRAQKFDFTCETSFKYFETFILVFNYKIIYFMNIEKLLIELDFSAEVIRNRFNYRWSI